MSKNSTQLIRDCLASWGNNRGVGYINGRPVTVNQLSDEQLHQVFSEYIKQIKDNKIAMPAHWRNIFLKVDEDAAESVILDD